MESTKKTFIVKDFELRHNNDDDNFSVAIAGYLGKDSHVIIPKCIQNFHVKAIDEIAFLSSSIKKITIEKGVADIGHCAFMFCSKLIDVELPDGLLCIDYLAFKRCKRLAKIRFPDTVIDIQCEALHNCKKLTAVTFPDKFLSLPGGIFIGCNQLKKVIISRKTIMWPNAFLGSHVNFAYID
jgi:hypothetical protein